VGVRDGLCLSMGSMATLRSRNGIEGDDDVADRLSRLTARQREVLVLIARGWNTKSIAVELSVSVKTIESHRSNLKERLEIFDIAGLVRFAIKVGLVSLDD